MLQIADMNPALLTMYLNKHPRENPLTICVQSTLQYMQQIYLICESHEHGQENYRLRVHHNIL